jgi:uncharacterized protein YjiS (DUF1127 family)
MQGLPANLQIAPDARSLEPAMYDLSSARSRLPRQHQWTIFDLCLAAARDLAWLIAGIADELRIRRDIRRLAAMDDRTLKDFGLGRCEIEYRVRYGSHG